jgi:hypothetical protein
MGAYGEMMDGGRPRKNRIHDVGEIVWESAGIHEIEEAVWSRRLTFERLSKKWTSRVRRAV